MNDHLFIPDCHVKHGQNLDRFKWLSNLILDRRPEVIVCAGDFADMESLCSYDKGLRKFEGRRYKKDIDAAIDAQTVLFAPLAKLQKQQRDNKKKVYSPLTVMMIGNHEHRIERATQLDPILEDTISIDDLKYHEYWDEVWPFLESDSINGVHYAHYFVSGVMGRPINGEHPAAYLLAKQHVSCTVGHSHLVDYAQRTAANGKKLHGLVGGCFTEEYEDYAGVANDLWWRGVVYKHNVKDGEYDPEFISIERLKEEYGS